MDVESAETAMPYPEELEIADHPDLRLRLSSETDTPELFRLMMANEQHLARSKHLDVADLSEEKVEKGVEEMLNNMRGGSFVQYRIMVGEEIAGSVTLHHIDRERHEASMGYWIGVEFSGNGYATMAARQLVNYGFEEMGLEKILLEIRPENPRSEALAARLGARLTDRVAPPDEDDVEDTEYRIWEIDKS